MDPLVVGTPTMARVAINGNAGADVVVDVTQLTVASGVSRILPWARIDIRSAGGLDIWFAAIAGEITAGRYQTLPGGSINTIEGPGSFEKLYLRGGTGAADTAEITVYR